MKKLLKNKYEYPVERYQENLIFSENGDIWAYYFVGSTNINLQDIDGVSQYKSNFRYTLQELARKYHTFDFSIYPFEVNLMEQINELSSDFNTETPEISMYYMKKMVNQLSKQFGKVTKPKFVLGIKLREYNQVSSKIELIKGTLKHVNDRLIQALTPTNTEEEQAIEELFQEEQDLFSEVSSFQPERLTSEQTAYLLKMNFLRNTPHLRADEERVQSINELSEGILYPNAEKGMLAVETEYGKQFMGFLPLSELPDYTLNTRLFYRLQNLKFPVEFHIKADVMPADGLTGVKAQVSNKRKLFKVNAKEAAQFGDPASVQLVKNIKKTEDIQEDIDQENALFQWLGCFVVYGQTAEICRNRIKYLKKYFGKMNVRLEFPIVDQEKLFYRFIQGEGAIGKYWRQQTNAYGLSEFLFGLTNELGNNIGIYLGVQNEGSEATEREKAIKQSRKAVFINLFASNQNISSASTASPHIHILGKTGNGKSFLVKLLFYMLLLLKAKVLYFDPKLEIYKTKELLLNDPEFMNEYPEFVQLLENLQFITLDVENKDNYGILDPLVFLTPNEARTVAEGIINNVYDLDKNDDVKVEVLKMLNVLIKEREQGEKVGLRTLITRLKENDISSVRKFAEILDYEVQNSLLELVFSDGDKEGIKFNQQSLVLSVKGLSLPKPTVSPKYYDKVQKKSLAIMLCVGKYIELFGSQDDSEYTFEIFDEAWTLSKSAVGQEIINKIKKVGRAQKNGCIFVTQSVADVNADETKGQVGMIFCFDEDSEREDILKELGLPVNEENKKLLKNLKQGQCIMRDIYQRTGKLSIDCLFDEWLIANKTVEQTASGQLEEKYR